MRIIVGMARIVLCVAVAVALYQVFDAPGALFGAVLAWPWERSA